MKLFYPYLLLFGILTLQRWTEKDLNMHNLMADVVISAHVRPRLPIKEEHHQRARRSVKRNGVLLMNFRLLRIIDLMDGGREWRSVVQGI